MRVMDRFSSTKENDNRSLWMLKNRTLRTIHFALIDDSEVVVRNEQAKHETHPSTYIDNPKGLVNPHTAERFLLENGYPIPAELRRKLGK